MNETFSAYRLTIMVQPINADGEKVAAAFWAESDIPVASWDGVSVADLVERYTKPATHAVHHRMAKDKT